MILAEVFKLETTCRRRAGVGQTLKSRSGCLSKTPGGGGSPLLAGEAASTPSPPLPERCSRLNAADHIQICLV